jgi:hypothetical protein
MYTYKKMPTYMYFLSNIKVGQTPYLSLRRAPPWPPVRFPSRLHALPCAREEQPSPLAMTDLDRWMQMKGGS